MLTEPPKRVTPFIPLVRQKDGLSADVAAITAAAL